MRMGILVPGQVTVKQSDGNQGLENVLKLMIFSRKRFLIVCISQLIYISFLQNRVFGIAPCTGSNKMTDYSFSRSSKFVVKKLSSLQRILIKVIAIFVREIIMIYLPAWPQ